MATRKPLVIVDGQVQEVPAQDSLAGVLPDAPSDGKPYARKDGAWAEVTLGVAAQPVSSVSVVYTDGRATAVTEDGVTKSITYDTHGRVATVSYPYAGKTRTETYTYNTSGQLAGMTASDTP